MRPEGILSVTWSPRAHCSPEEVYDLRVVRFQHKSRISLQPTMKFVRLNQVTKRYLTPARLVNAHSPSASTLLANGDSLLLRIIVRFEAQPTHFRPAYS
ncbi:hypothetical protein BU25DRAFT_408496, partial [Macroventuria anomochaeta]